MSSITHRRAAALALAFVPAASLCAQTRQDLFVALPNPLNGADFDLWHYTSTASPLGFTSPGTFGTDPGTVVAIEPADSKDGAVYVAADIPAAGGGTVSVVYEYVSPFMVSTVPPTTSGRIRHQTLQPDLITDLKFDGSPAGNPFPGSDRSVIVVVRDTISGGGFLRRVPLLGGLLVSQVSVPSAGQPLFVAVDPATGRIHVVDGAANLSIFDAALNQVSSAPIPGIQQVADVMWDDVPTGRPDPLVVSGTLTGGAWGAFRVVPGAAPIMTSIALHGLPVTGLTVDSAGNGFAVEDQFTFLQRIMQWDNATGTFTSTDIPGTGPGTGALQAMSWTGRAGMATFATSGTALLVSGPRAPALIGDTALQFTLVPGPAVALSPVFLGVSSQLDQNGPLLGPDGQILIDTTTAAGFQLYFLNTVTPPNVNFATPILPGFDGQTVFAQFLAVDNNTGNTITSSASIFVVGQRPSD